MSDGANQTEPHQKGPKSRLALAARARAVRAWTAARFQRGHAGRIAAWIAGGFFAALTLLVLIASVIDWNAFKGPVARFASSVSGKPVAIDGSLNVKILSLHPSVAITRLRVGNPAWARNEPPLANIGRAYAQADLWRTITSGLTLDALAFDNADLHLLRVAPGKANWSGSHGEKPLRLPVIGNFVVRDSKVHYEDRKRGLVLDGQFYSSESNGPDANRRPFNLVGQGNLNGRIFKINFVGAPLLNVRHDRPYGFRADVNAGLTRINAVGALARPFDFGSYRANLRLAGADLANLFYVTGLALPNTPPYRLRLVLTHRATGYDLTDIGGTIGDSDVHGTLNVERRNDRPYLTGAVRSNLLSFADLYTVLGAAAPKKAATAAPAQRIEAERLAAADRILPDARLDLHRVRNMDADVKYSAASLRAKGWPLRAFALHIKLDHGLLDLDPLTLELTQGRLAGAVSINARRDRPDVALDMRLSGARLERLLGASMKIPPLSGAVSGRIKLRGQGDTVRKVAASADGQASFAASHGEIRQALAELTGINVVKGLGLLLSNDQSKADVRCAVADFSVQNGVLRPRTLVFDTEDVLITGGGQASLGDERLALTLKGQPKEPRLIRVRAPIEIQGSFRKPHIGVDVGKAAGQAGIAAALATLLTPLSLVLPFIDPGLAHDADCTALLTQAKADAKRPVKTG